MQEVLVEAYRTLARFKVTQDSSFRGWLMKLLERRAIDMQRRYLAARRGGGKVDRLDTVAFASLADDEQRGQLVECELREEKELLDEAMASLREDYRYVLVCYGLEGRPSDEVAAEMGYKSGISVRVKYERAREKLVRAVERLRVEASQASE